MLTIVACAGFGGAPSERYRSWLLRQANRRRELDSDIVIVGAGPYGLSIAAHLRAAKQPFEIFGTALESWRTFMPEGMILKSERFASLVVSR
jgi:ribulose 1,5-bisphosphate synthetase/thiazole synthase